MLRFQHPDLFWLLLLSILLLVFFLYQNQQRIKAIRLFGDEKLVNALMPRYSQPLRFIKFGLLLLAFIIGIIGLANLQAGSRSEKIERKGIDVMIALDVSKSMLAQDLSPNRLEKAKQFVARLIEKLGNDRIGLITFAGRAYVSVPLTVDMSALKMNLSGASPNQVPTQGTVIGEAISMARQSFNAKETKYKSIIIISDGEDHDEGASDEVKKAVGEGIMINTLGIGSPEGSTIIDPETRENKKDEKGEDIITKLNEKELQDIASDGQGIYLRLGNTDAAAEAIAKKINSTEQKNFGDSIFSDYNSYYQYFLGISLLLIFVEFFIPDRKKPLPA
ncbi:MAG TPA: VWA domain-containing protein [Chitinophagaceae bacterium]|nr:VWA domain-containing protein [Chitinophagaceae bacterium]